jgi:hypothetical protein
MLWNFLWSSLNNFLFHFFLLMRFIEHFLWALQRLSMAFDVLFNKLNNFPWFFSRFPRKSFTILAVKFPSQKTHKLKFPSSFRHLEKSLETNNANIFDLRKFWNKLPKNMCFVFSMELFLLFWITLFFAVFLEEILWSRLLILSGWTFSVGIFEFN